jgi:hypothetical protein
MQMDSAPRDCVWTPVQYFHRELVSPIVTNYLADVLTLTLVAVCNFPTTQQEIAWQFALQIHQCSVRSPSNNVFFIVLLLTILTLTTIPDYV